MLLDDILGHFLGERFESFLKGYGSLRNSGVNDKTRGLVLSQIHRLRSEGQPFWWDVYMKCSEGDIGVSENQLVTFFANVLAGVRSAYNRRTAHTALKEYRETLTRMAQGFPTDDKGLERELRMCVDFVDHDSVKDGLGQIMKRTFNTSEEDSAWLKAYREHNSRKSLFRRK